ncbi:MAG: tetratricopeptide repeat protein [Spirochaetes bacterium]|nr:tetratricopeptide repeat protein [Spirochaetota bacterium]
MFKFLRNLFAKKPVEVDPDEIVREGWIAELSVPELVRFETIDEERYSASCGRGGFALEIRKPDLFAWAEIPLRRYDDFVLEAEILFDPANGRSAAGFIFRKTGERDFAYVLVSSAGYVRIDAVFNGKPHPVVAWTECPEPPGAAVGLTIIARGSRYVVLVNDRWACEGDDDTVGSGSLAFAGQNYGERDRAGFVLESLFLESRPVDVEALYYRLTAAAPVDPAQRVRLAGTFLAMGEPLPAIVELRKAGRDRSPDASASFLKAECAIALGLHEEAEEALDACLHAEPGHGGAREERANLLYLRGRFLDLRDELEADPGRVASSPRLSNLLGHAYANLGLIEKAAAAYGSAAELEPGMPLFSLNEARSRERAGDPEGAAVAFLRAARGFFDQNDFDDLAECLERLEALKPDDPGTGAISAKVLFGEGKYDQAAASIERLFRIGHEDSALRYLYGIILSDRGNRKDAVLHLAAAVAMEPEAPLYRFRLAEALFLSGDDPSEQLAKAVGLAPADGWIRNLEGQFLSAKGDHEGAAKSLRMAREALPGESSPAVNLAEALSRQGLADEALAALSAFPDDPACLNQRGNVLVAAGRIEEAAFEYSKAIRLAKGVVPPRDESDYLANYASCCSSLDRWTDAEEALRRAYELYPGAGVLRLLGDVASVYGDWVRAETAYRSAVETDPSDAAAREALARNYLTRGLSDKANAAAASLAEVDPARGMRFAAELLETTTELVSCASCERGWRVPRNIPFQSAASIHAMPPDESPAGACPSCGKVFCIGCRKDQLSGDRFTCPDCGVPLKLTDDRLRWLVREHIRETES